MRIRDLIEEWEQDGRVTLAAREFAVRLPVYDAARLLALSELYPTRTEVQLITELLSAAFDELEASLPYVKGSEVIAEDDQGDPIYKDDGLTPRFHLLTRKYVAQLQQGFELEHGC
ncbi:MAG: type 1 pili tip component [Gammaproteobacteria bacterium]